MFKRTKVYTIPEFLALEKRTSPAMTVRHVASAGLNIGGFALVLGVTFLLTGMAEPTFASTVPTAIDPAHPVSSVYDEKIWPLFIDIGEPLAKTMMAIGIYRVIRNDVDKGWKMIYRSGVGLVGLYLIDGAIHIIQGVGLNLQQS